MSEVLAQDGAPVGPAGQSAGAMLRQAREAAGLHVAAMAVAMKVPVAKLEALEQDRHDLLPDAVFARALASTVCRTLKIDPRPVLERLPQTTAPRLVQDNEGLNAPFRSPRDVVAPNWREQLTRPVSLVVAALLLGALVVVLLPRTHFDEMLADTAKSAADAAPAATAPVAAEPVKALAAPEQPASPIVPASMTIPAPAKHAPEAPAAAAAPPPAEPAASAAAAAASPAPAVAGAVVFRATAQSWIEVRDAKGAVPLRKVLAAGESAGVSGAMPLQVVVGNVSGTEVAVRGKPYDLKPLARDNVARFELK